MVNLTLVVDETVLRQARARAGSEGTSVNARVREYLSDYASHSEQRTEARRRLIALADRSRASSRGTSWTRDDLHE